MTPRVSKSKANNPCTSPSHLQTGRKRKVTKNRKPRARAVCTGCQKRHRKCSTRRPVCDHCLKIGGNCVYEDTRRRPTKTGPWKCTPRSGPIDSRSATSTLPGPSPDGQYCGATIESPTRHTLTQVGSGELTKWKLPCPARKVSDDEPLAIESQRCAAEGSPSSSPATSQSVYELRCGKAAAEHCVLPTDPPSDAWWTDFVTETAFNNSTNDCWIPQEPAEAADYFTVQLYGSGTTLY